MDRAVRRITRLEYLSPNNSENALRVFWFSLVSERWALHGIAELTLFFVGMCPLFRVGGLGFDVGVARIPWARVEEMMFGFVLLVGVAVVVVVVVRPFRLAGLKLAVFVNRCMRSVFARVGWRSMSMGDLQRAALAEALRLRSVGVSGNVYLPSVLEVSLSEPDWVVVDRASEFFIGEVAAALRGQAEEQGWAVGVITITLVLEPDFAPGRVDVSEASKAPVLLYPPQQPLTVPMSDILVSGPPRTIAMDEMDEVDDVEPVPKTQLWPGLSLRPVSDGLPTIGAGSADNELVVGRLDTSDRVVDSPIVSGTHFILRRNNLGWTCTDLGSKNGTLVNNKRADTPVVLTAGDFIRIGATHCWEVALPL